MTPAERARHAALVRWGKKNPLAARVMAARERRKAAAATDKDAERTQNLSAVGDALMEADAPLSKRGLEALAAFAAGGSLTPDLATSLASLGVVTLGADGTPRLSADGRRVVRAAERGDIRGALDAAFAAGERVGVGRAGEKLPQQESANKEPKPEQPKKRGGGGGGGGGGKQPAPTAEERQTQRQQERDQRAADTAREAGLRDLDALRQAADRGGAESDELRTLGLIDEAGDATDQGRRALGALERGDMRGYRAALQDAAARQRRETERTTRSSDAERRRTERETERQRRDAERDQRRLDVERQRSEASRQELDDLLADFEAGRSGLSMEQQRRLRRAGLIEYDANGKIRRPARATKAADRYTPPESARNNARRGLELRRKWGRGGTAVGVARARDLANGRDLSRSTVARMASFNRHRANALDGRTEADGGPSAATIAWLLWGGTTGVDWARGITGAMKHGSHNQASHGHRNDSVRTLLRESATKRISLELDLLEIADD